MEIFNANLLEQKTSSGLESMLILFGKVSNKADFTKFHLFMEELSPAPGIPAPIIRTFQSPPAWRPRAEDMKTWSCSDCTSCTILVHSYQTELEELFRTSVPGAARRRNSSPQAPSDRGEPNLFVKLSEGMLQPPCPNCHLLWLFLSLEDFPWRLAYLSLAAV